MNEHTSLEKYTSHTLFEIVAKGLRKGYVWEVSWRLNKLQHIDPQFLCLLQHFFLILLGCSIGGPEGPYPSAGCWLSLQHFISNSDSSELNLSVASGYTIVWRSPASCGRHICTQFNPSTVKVIPWYLRLDAPVPWLTAGSKVNMLHTFIAILPSLLWPGVVTSDRNQIELFKHLTVCKQITDVELLVLHSNTWNHMNVLSFV